MGSIILLPNTLAAGLCEPYETRACVRKRALCTAASSALSGGIVAPSSTSCGLPSPAAGSPPAGPAAEPLLARAPGASRQAADSSASISAGCACAWPGRLELCSGADRRYHTCRRSNGPYVRAGLLLSLEKRNPPLPLTTGKTYTLSPLAMRRASKR